MNEKRQGDGGKATVRFGQPLFSNAHMEGWMLIPRKPRSTSEDTYVYKSSAFCSDRQKTIFRHGGNGMAERDTSWDDKNWMLQT